MRKLPLILFGAIAALASISVGQGCGDSTTNTGGSGPGGGNAGGATTQGNGGTTTPGNGGSSATVSPTSSGGSSPGTGGATPGSGGATPGTGGSGGGMSCTGVELTVVNYLDWCAVKIGSGAFDSTDIVQTACVDASSTITLEAKAKNASFEIEPKMWHHTDGDMGQGEDGMQSMGVSTANVTVATTKKCVWVCCEDAGISDCPPATSDQCIGH